MNRLNLFFILLISSVLIACKSNSRKALDFNNEITGLELALTPQISDASTKIQSFFEENKLDSVVAVSKRMEIAVDAGIDKIKGLAIPDLTGATDLHKGFIKYLGHIKNVFTQYRLVGEAKDETEKQSRVVAMESVLNDIPAILKEVQGVQKKFADANNMKIENK
jgi:hypothetical protein